MLQLAKVVPVWLCYCLRGTIDICAFYLTSSLRFLTLRQLRTLDIRTRAFVPRVVGGMQVYSVLGGMQVYSVAQNSLIDSARNFTIYYRVYYHGYIA